LCGHLVMHSMQSDAPNVRTPKGKGNPCGLFTGTTVCGMNWRAPLARRVRYPGSVGFALLSTPETGKRPRPDLVSATCFPLSVEP
jgi:hypothetical protein